MNQLVLVSLNLQKIARQIWFVNYVVFQFEDFPVSALCASTEVMLVIGWNGFEEGMFVQQVVDVIASNTCHKFILLKVFSFSFYLNRSSIFNYIITFSSNPFLLRFV